MSAGAGGAAVDLDAVAELVRHVAATVHVPLFGRGVEAEHKAPGELVSRVDREAEALLHHGLRDLTPGLPVVGEEAASVDPSVLAVLRGERAVWLVDPLDGTPQFLAGSPDHAVMVALVHRGRTVCAVVHQPQHLRTYTAEAGSGTWRDGVRLRCASADPGEPGRLRGAVLRRFLPPEVRAAVAANEHRFGDLTPHTTCAGVEYPRLVEGGADFLLCWRTLPWDHAPGALLLTEAGGAALRPDLTAYRSDDDASGLLAACDGATGRAVLRGLGLTAG